MWMNVLSTVCCVTTVCAAIHLEATAAAALKDLFSGQKQTLVKVIRAPALPEFGGGARVNSKTSHQVKQKVTFSFGSGPLLCHFTYHGDLEKTLVLRVQSPESPPMYVTRSYNLRTPDFPVELSIQNPVSLLSSFQSFHFKGRF